jgi:hypothetical protein
MEWRLIERWVSSHRYAVAAVERASAGCLAYNEAPPSIWVRVRMYLSILRERLAQSR